MPRSTKTKPLPVHSEPIPPKALELIGGFFAAADMGSSYYDLEPWQQQIARISQPFRALCRTAEECSDCNSEVSLTLIHERSRSPEGKSPRDWMATQQGRESGWPSESFDDRGEAGIFTSWDMAVWYTSWMQPDRFTTDDVLLLLYGD